MRFQVIAAISMVLAVGAGESLWMTVVMGANMCCKVSSPREGTGAKWALESKIWQEWGHACLCVVATVLLFAKGLVFNRVAPDGIVAFPVSVKLVEFV